jgi:hypothetical protein
MEKEVIDQSDPLEATNGKKKPGPQQTSLEKTEITMMDGDGW